ncbi:hypothetical protein [Micromonospora sp. WMMD987]|jgi:hypothetical protein|uniref:hypothetical protein n=1 Tax=Micromonospora TaxID=1873 RepID=UPI00249A28F9|nr:hypothetical protein [Micromonospora sp. WMMD987]WFE95964.1 hypothetical protein O7612_03295 [Micromonospora sp. WMMD987]
MELRQLAIVVAAALAVLLVLAVLALVVNMVISIWSATRSLTREEREPQLHLPARRCLRCRGTGWLNREPERTHTFTGDGFEDRHTPARICPDCGGTGTNPQGSAGGRQGNG